jgi:hypothetical protein
MLEVMASCPVTARQLERYSWKPQTQAMREGDRWQTIDESDDLATCLRYFVQTDPRYEGRGAIDYGVIQRARERARQERQRRGLS